MFEDFFSSQFASVRHGINYFENISQRQKICEEFPSTRVFFFLSLLLIIFNCMSQNTGMYSLIRESSMKSLSILICSETFPEQIDCGEYLIIIMSIVLPFALICSLLICWIIRPLSSQSTFNLIAFDFPQQIPLHDFLNKFNRKKPWK